jgi:1,4-dihydroxy-2-naphthoyl-CoA synthase
MREDEMMSYETITYETPERGIGILSLNRPKAYNAVSIKMVEELEGFWHERLYDLDTAVSTPPANGFACRCSIFPHRSPSEQPS